MSYALNMDSTDDRTLLDNLNWGGAITIKKS